MTDVAAVDDGLVQHSSRSPKPKTGSDTARANFAPKNFDKTGTFLRGLDGRAWRFDEDAGKWWL